MPATLYVLAPSFFCLVVNGILLFILLLMVIFNFRSFITTDYIKLLPIIGNVAIAIGMHGMLHLGLEQAYNYNPLYLLFN